jgi:hypothetical protein
VAVGACLTGLVGLAAVAVGACLTGLVGAADRARRCPTEAPL